MRGRIVLSVGLTAILLAAPLIGAAIFRMAWIALIYVVVVVPAFFLANRLYYAYVKRARLEADIETSKVVGGVGFSEVLKKIYAMGLWDVNKREAGKSIRVSGISGLPTVSQRIKNLQHLLPTGMPTGMPEPAVRSERLDE